MWLKDKENNSQNDGYDISNIPFQRREPDEERKSVVMAHINRSQTYPAILTPSKSRKELANWNWVRLGIPRPKINNLEGADQRHWQRKRIILTIRYFERSGDTAEPESVEEEEQIQLDKSEKSEKRQGGSLEDLW